MEMLVFAGVAAVLIGLVVFLAERWGAWRANAKHADEEGDRAEALEKQAERAPASPGDRLRAARRRLRQLRRKAGQD